MRWIREPALTDMYQAAIEKIRRSIFPIFYQTVSGKGLSLGVSGTGFFVGEGGYFLTAHHVTTDVPDHSRLLYAGNIPEHPVAPRDILEVFSDPERDIFLGRVEPDFLPPVTLAGKNPNIGASICLSGYPLASPSRNPDGSINVRNVRMYWQPTCVIDYISAEIEHRKHRGFITQHTSLRGMSGGPVFDPGGVVFGIDAATLTRKIPEDPDNPEKITAVKNGIVIGIETIQDILRRQNLLP